MGNYPRLDVARKRLNRLKKKGLRRIGDVILHQNTEFCWFFGSIGNRQHEAELSELELHIEAHEIRRLYEVDPEFRPDMEIVIRSETGEERVFPLEHECSEKLNNRQIQKKMERYGDRFVLWTCKKQGYLDKLASFAPSDKHLFTLYDLAIEPPLEPGGPPRFHDPIWTNRQGTLHDFPRSVQSAVQ